MNFLIIPAVVSFIIKIFLISKNRHPLSPSYYTATLVICVLHSLCEVVAIYKFSQGHNIDFLFRAYYILTIWIFSLCFVYSALLTGKSKLNAIIIIFSSILSVLILFTNTVLSGYIDKGYSITAVQEEYYWLIVVQLLFCIFGAIFLLIKQLFYKANPIAKETQCYYLLLSLIAPFTVIPIIILSIYFNWNLSAIGILPLAYLIFSILFIKSNKYLNIKKIELLSFSPWSIEKKLSQQLNVLNSQFIKGEVGLKQADEEFQILLIKYQKNKGYSKLTSAKNLGLSRSSLYSKLNRFKIDWKD